MQLDLGPSTPWLAGVGGQTTSAPVRLVFGFMFVFFLTVVPQKNIYIYIFVVVVSFLFFVDPWPPRRTRFLGISWHVRSVRVTRTDLVKIGPAL